MSANMRFPQIATRPPDLGKLPYKFEPLAWYNAECARGLVHTAEMDAQMALLQAEFDAWAEGAAMRVELYRAADGWRLRVKAANGEIVATGEAYSRKWSAKRAASRLWPDLECVEVPE